MSQCVYYSDVDALHILESALSDLLASVVAYDCDHAGSLPKPRSVPDHTFERPDESMDLTRLLKTPPTPADWLINGLSEQPIRTALTNAIRRIGKTLWKLVGLDGMIAVAERVCNRPLAFLGHDQDGSDFSRQMAIVDSAWDGIGDWMG